MSAGTIIIGIGNRFRGDDALGPLVVDALKGRGLEAVEHSGEPAGLMEIWAGRENVVLVDCVFSGAASGTIHEFDLIAEKLPANFSRATSHALGIAEAVEFARVLGKMPPAFRFLGVEGEQVQQGAPLSPVVGDAVAILIEQLSGA